ncbi:FAD-dependent oxidoreductase [Amycolatopsis suaedae]|uniref:FAD-dependent monooxygenase n=1 Tax=Amycolatopsis suaedae TaxID=2510978 RepID=A0A4Q7JF73_9PSEU|nr:NAD(P)/FAD-dependent oxidoreductase [Amycolatopsis suaedae]RZQ65856.1 FAD-dependent monooxygenase [Amycolatopsis suaedae]
MLEPTEFADQYARACRDDLRILVVGAGIAGITAAQLLRRDGRNPVLVERSRDGGHPGYMLALMPMVDPVLDDLGIRADYRARSTPLARYGLHGHTGRLIRVDSMTRILDRYGDYRGISRGELIEALTPDGGAVTYDTTVTAVDSPTVTLRTGGTSHDAEFDLVVIADGIHSATRDLVGRPAATLDTGWGGWVVWSPGDADPDLGEELWGAGFFLGVYPVLGELGVFLGGPGADTAAGPAAFVRRVRERLTTTGPRVDAVLDAVATAEDPYFWALTDCRAPAWTGDGTVLLGDAAAGFLPTAGIGAGMAMESAWVLARTLRTARRDTLPALLRAYEREQRPRVEAAQDTSRRLARLMFHRSRALAVLRDLTTRFVSVDVALKPIQRLLAERPEPGRVRA